MRLSFLAPLSLVPLLLAGLLPAAIVPEARAADPASPRVVDDFSGTSNWTAHPADGVELVLGTDEIDGDPALRLDFHFEGGGYAIARRELELPLPENYAITFRVRGEGPSNHLEFKLVDGSGENVWWFVHRDVEFGPSYETFRIPKRKVQFAWGPRGGGEIDTVRAIEFAITAGDGGTGTLWIDDLTVVPLPPPDTSPLAPTASGSSESASAHLALDGNPGTAWTSSDRSPWFLVDLGRSYEFSGLILDWGVRHPAEYRVELSDDATNWREAASIEESAGGRARLFLPDSETRFLRISAAGGEDPGVHPVMELREIEIAAATRFPNREAFFGEIARASPRGLYPRGMFGEQSYWTVVGLDDDELEVLVGEEGAVELWAGGPSVEPFLAVDGYLLSWADATIGNTLLDGYLPIPTIRWDLPGLRLETTPVAEGTSDDAGIWIRYRVSNPGQDRRHGDLVLALRPFQVNPPSQTLNLSGGTASLGRLELSSNGAFVDGWIPLQVAPAARWVATLPFAGGDIVADHLASGALPPPTNGESTGDGQTAGTADPFGAASGALAFSFSLEPGESEDIVVRFPLVSDRDESDPPLREDRGERTNDAAESGGSPVRNPDDGPDHGPDHGPAGLDAGSSAVPGPWNEGASEFGRVLAIAKEQWHEKLDRVRITLPGVAERHVETMRAQLGFILVNRSGAAIQPGVRSYARSWIRDGALTSAALLRCGHASAAQEFLEWYAPHQYANGKIPCVVDYRGADPVPEHDSNGEFIFLVAEIYRFTHDRALAERYWPQVFAAVGYLDALRHERLGPEYQTEEMRAFYGILPPSISHEGYSAKPMHSYWDDFFALRGFRDAAFLAEELARPEAESLAVLAAGFARDLGASIQAARELHGIDFVPGCADLGDFDPTSTTIALTPVGVDGVVPRKDLETTFERYWDFFVHREETEDWDAYTPYELRNVGAFVRLGWRDRAHHLMDFFFDDQRPAGWRSWAEVVAREERTPRFLGDIPHTWVGSDYIRSFLDMFVAVDPSDRFATVGSGVPAPWLEGDGVTIESLPTPFGALDLRMRRTDQNLEVSIGGEVSTPPEGWILEVPPGAAQARVDGTPVSPAEGHIRLRHTPAHVVFELAPDRSQGP